MDEGLALLHSNLLDTETSVAQLKEVLPRFSASEQCGTCPASEIMVRVDSRRLSPIYSIGLLAVPCFGFSIACILWQYILRNGQCVRHTHAR
jgi:hypothetical protein